MKRKLMTKQRSILIFGLAAMLACVATTFSAHAEACALVRNGAVIGYEVTSGGAGYSSPPTVSVPNVKGATATVQLSFGKVLESNGAVSSITVPQEKAK